MNRRNLDLRSANDVITEINGLREGGYAKTKNWNLTQVCQHLNETMKGGMDGFGFRAPWILRATVMKWIFNYALKSRKMMSGAPTLKSLKPDGDVGQDDDAVIDECIATIKRAESYDGSMEDYPLLNGLTPDKWRDIMWLHASHHLGFLVPTGE